MSAYPLVQVKRIATVTLGKMLQSSPDEDSDVLAPYLRAAHVQPSGRIIELEEQPMWFTPRELHALSLCAGDVVVVEGGAGYGRSAVLPEGLPGWGFQNSILRVRSDPQQSTGAFVNYALQSALDSGAIAIACNMSTFAHFTAEKLSAFEIPCPPLEDQHSVVAFLDRETAEIDAFIADQEELIGLLTERRAATISHAVTKGLDPSVPMKDSGVEWLGDIPQHWESVPLKRVLRRIIQGVSPQAEGGLADIDSAGVLRAGCVNGGVFNDLEHKRLPEGFCFDDTIRVRVGDLIVNRASGSPALVGSCARVRELNFDLILSDKTFRLDPLPSVEEDFIELYMNSSVYRRQVLGVISGAEGLANNLPMSALKGIALALPPQSEQRSIASVTRSELSELDAAIADAREAIALSKERRAALISAAVTGKIDVRGMM